MIEIAVILVIIGLISVVAIKSINLYENYLNINQVRKIIKIKSAIVDFYESHATPDGESQDSFVSYKQSNFIDRGYLTADDFIVNLGSDGYGNKRSTLFISSVTENDSFFSENLVSDPMYKRNYAIIVHMNLSGEGKEPRKTLPRFVCIVETYMDDKSLTSGDGKIFSELTISPNIPQIDYSNCTKLEMEYIPYGYKVFIIPWQL